MVDPTAVRSSDYPFRHAIRLFVVHFLLLAIQFSNDEQFLVQRAQQPRQAIHRLSQFVDDPKITGDEPDLHADGFTHRAQLHTSLFCNRQIGFASKLQVGSWLASLSTFLLNIIAFASLITRRGRGEQRVLVPTSSSLGVLIASLVEKAIKINISTCLPGGIVIQPDAATHKMMQRILQLKRWS